MRSRHRNTLVPQPETGERIRAARTSRGLSIRDFDVSSSTLTRLEQGERVPSMDILIDIAATLKTTALELATGRHGTCPYCGRGRNPGGGLLALLLLVVVLAELVDLILSGTDVLV